MFSKSVLPQNLNENRVQSGVLRKACVCPLVCFGVFSSFTLCAFVYLLAFQGALFDGRLPMDEKILLLNFFLGDSCLYSVYGSTIFLSAPHTAT